MSEEDWRIGTLELFKAYDKDSNKMLSLKEFEYMICAISGNCPPPEFGSTTEESESEKESVSSESEEQESDEEEDMDMSEEAAPKDEEESMPMPPHCHYNKDGDIFCHSHEDGQVDHKHEEEP